MIRLYSLLIALLSPLVFLGFVWRYGLRRTLKGLGQRFGFGLGNAPAGTRVLWVHAASVGEVRAVESFLREVPARFPGFFRLLTATTVAGKELAERLRVADEVRLAPIDLPFCVGRFLDAKKPRALLLVETELWPNWLSVLSRREVPVLLINGRLSDRSFPSYRLLKGLLRPLFAGLTVGAQSPRQQERFWRIGVDALRVRVTGNLKFDVPLPDLSRRGEAFSRFGFDASDRVFVCGSTREGEERLLMDVFESLRQQEPSLKMVLAPRHIERVPEIAQLLRERGIPFRLRSQSSASSPRAPHSPSLVLILDTLGELPQAYGVASWAFVGGSLVGKGGQNPLEPARWGVPVLFGASMENFQETADFLIKEGAAAQVRDGTGLEARLRSLLQDGSMAIGMGQSARRAAQAQGGAVEGNLKLLEEILQTRG